MSASGPATVSGGCLCGSIRYKIAFEAENSWPPMVATCQCGLCRKWTGCLVSTDLIVGRTQVTPSLSDFPTMKYHESSPGTKRGFCSNCGSGIFWLNDGMPDEMIVFVGTIDEEYLMGKVVGESIKETEHGQEFARESGYAKILCEPSAGNLYWQNAIEGITDGLPGPRFLQHFVGKAPLP